MKRVTRLRWLSTVGIGGAAMVVALVPGCGSSSAGDGSIEGEDSSVDDGTTGTDSGTEASSAGEADASPAPTPGSDAGDSGTTEDGGTDAGTPEDDASDSGSTDGGSADAGPWSPTELSGLVLWLDGHRGLAPSDGGVGDAGDAGHPLVWLDQSGQQNNATAVGSPSVDPTGVKGQPAVHFNGLNDYLLVPDSTSLQWGTGDFVVAVVLQHTTPTDAGAYGAIYSKQISNVGPYYGPSLWANTPNGTSALLAEVYNNTSTGLFDTATTGLNDGTPFLVVLHRAVLPSDGGLPADAGPDAGAIGSLGVLVNGADAGAATGPGYAANISAVGYPARIGGTQAGQDLQGDIAEMIAVKGSLSDADIQTLETYLMNKYAL